MRTDEENFFNAMITAGMTEREDGHVDAPTGHFAVLYIYDDDRRRRELANEVGMPIPDTLARGRYYLVVTDSQGFIRYDGPSCCRHSAGYVFDGLERDYAAWAEDGQDAIADASGGTWGE